MKLPDVINKECFTFGCANKTTKRKHKYCDRCLSFLVQGRMTRANSKALDAQLVKEKYARIRASEALYDFENSPPQTHNWMEE